MPTDQDGLDWFASWAHERSGTGPGAKLFMVDELWELKDRRGQLPKSVEGIVRGLSRHVGLETVISTQNPRDYSLNILSQATEIVCFRLELKEDLDVLKQKFPDVEQVRDFPPGRFVSYDVDRGTVRHGQLEPGWPPGRFLKVRPPV